MSNSEFHRAILTGAVVLMAFSLYSIACVCALAYTEYRYLPRSRQDDA